VIVQYRLVGPRIFADDGLVKHSDCAVIGNNLKQAYKHLKHCCSPSFLSKLNTLGVQYGVCCIDTHNLIKLALPMRNKAAIFRALPGLGSCCVQATIGKESRAQRDVEISLFPYFPLRA
jgi:hypothetical protein